MIVPDVNVLVLASRVRLMTNPRILVDSSTPSQAREFAQAVLDAPASVVVRPGGRHWPLFSSLVATHRLPGNDIPDAYLAAIAIEVGAHLAG